MLSAHYGVEHLSTGDVFRAAVAQGTPTGLEVKRYLDTGELVPDDIVIRVVDEHFAAGGPLEDGFILDGFPRTLVQAEELEQVLADHPLDLVINIDVPTDTILHRIAGRRVCVNCGASYHVTSAPKVNWTCDVCGGEVVQRDDDTEAAVATRLEVYAAPDGADHRLLLRPREAGRGRRRRRGQRGPGASDQGDRRALRSPVEVDHPQERRAARADATGGRGGGRDARAAASAPRCRGRRRSTSTRWHARCWRGAVRSRTSSGYHGFPAVVCTSPNDVIVHGIPSADVVLQEGDILSIDCGAIIEGWHGDAAVTVPIGEVDDESTRLMEVTRRSLEAAIEQVVDGHRLGDVGAAVEGIAEQAGFSVVREYVGHGIGTAMHEDPNVPNYGPAGRGMKLKEGHVFAIEPMVNAGTAETEVLDDGWTVVTLDGRRSAHFEHTIAVTEHGPEVLTLPR